MECSKYPKQKDPNIVTDKNKAASVDRSGQDIKIEVLNVEHLKYVFAFYAFGITMAMVQFLYEILTEQLLKINCCCL